ncbi:bifunctional phosphopantothenoylcysteine decarboxylase/phosphopantothenate--cysteine ligase CoaBC [Marinomonas sp. MED121]|uniref:bifunctional phosphopantothenoylcysteine decarboxylase/phosphopantothenate--cysteine ligase CoaBC n=1 Tax=Marinomonas sp. MED121 TaxID=314277 RepID=UPI00055C42EA|nr:bifunctional phosphopantothenoylcysteine decarboxylase/phosphopantothenate--cysteine ligase CoaBC [Marinomonas sp. MED121]
MSALAKKRVLLGITGGIAAYKSIELVRLLKKAGADVQVVLTEGAKAFVTPMTLQAVSGLPVRTSLLDVDAEAGMGHIELAKWADLIIIAPASADFIARQTQGMANDLLSTLCLATTADVWLAPAMNQAMWSHPATQDNIQRLLLRGVKLIGPDSGDQACGDVGYGRMSEPAAIFKALEQSQEQAQPLLGQHWLITAGPTMEAIDPVRFISNHSSGKMGYALADVARSLGAKVSLVSGPVAVTAATGVELHPVKSALDMLDKCREIAANHQPDVFIGAAAVADFRLKEVASQKMKKQADSDEMQLTLVKNPDIIATMVSEQQAKFVVGFAAETQNLLAYAKDKLTRKGLDLIIANDVSRSDIGFNQDQNQVTVVGKDQTWTPEQAAKTELAKYLVTLIQSQYQAH